MKLSHALIWFTLHAYSCTTLTHVHNLQMWTPKHLQHRWLEDMWIKTSYSCTTSAAHLGQYLQPRNYWQKTYRKASCAEYKRDNQKIHWKKGSSSYGKTLKMKSDKKRKHWNDSYLSYHFKCFLRLFPLKKSKRNWTAERWIWLTHTSITSNTSWSVEEFVGKILQQYDHALVILKAQINSPWSNSSMQEHLSLYYTCINTFLVLQRERERERERERKNFASVHVFVIHAFLHRFMYECVHICMCIRVYNFMSVCACMCMCTRISSYAYCHL